MKWFKGTLNDAAAGRESRSAFIAQAAFWIAAVRFLTSGLSLKIGTWTMNLGTVDAMLLGAFLAPCLALYWGRRSVPGQPDVKMPPPLGNSGGGAVG